MLSIQTGLPHKKITFGDNERQLNQIQNPIDYNKANNNEINDRFVGNEQEIEYNNDKSFWEDQKQTFNDLSKDVEVPSIFKKGAKVISVIVSGILGGMAMVWGSKKSIGAMEALAKTKKVKAFTNKTITKYKTIKTKFNKIKNSKILKLLINKIHKRNVKRFNNSKFGQSKIVKIFIGSFKFIKNKAIKGLKFISKKIKGVKKEQVKTATVNTMGISGGITSGITAIKEIDKTNEGTL